MRNRWILGVFFLSGFAALIYQLVWQRALFSIFGTNVESVTVVITAFMLGLGAGSLVGGEVSRSPGRPLLLLFGAAEALIGVYGLVSLRLFAWVASWTGQTSVLGAGLFSFVLVLVPTLLMGATLPLLLAHAVRCPGATGDGVANVGRSVGILYFCNTIGAAAGAFAAAVLVLGRLGLQGSAVLAAATNFVIAAGVLVLVRADAAGKAGSATGPGAGAAAGGAG